MTAHPNYGIAGGTVDPAPFQDPLRPGPDGYTDMTEYNRRAPWSGETAAANAAAAELIGAGAERN
jgi:hypothetical protein